MTGRFRVVPTPATRLTGDEATEVDLDATGRSAIEPTGPGSVVVRPGRSGAGPDAADIRVTVGGPRRAPAGQTTVEIVVDGWRFELEVEDAARAELRRRATRTPDAAGASGPTEIRAIIPGRVAAIRVVVGDVVEAGQSLLVVEAMKMQNELRAPRAGTVERVAVADADTIDNGDLLVVLR